MKKLSWQDVVSETRVAILRSMRPTPPERRHLFPICPVPSCTSPSILSCSIHSFPSRSVPPLPFPSRPSSSLSSCPVPSLSFISLAFHSCPIPSPSLTSLPFLLSIPHPFLFFLLHFSFLPFLLSRLFLYLPLLFFFPVPFLPVPSPSLHLFFHSIPFTSFSLLLLRFTSHALLFPLLLPFPFSHFNSPSFPSFPLTLLSFSFFSGFFPSLSYFLLYPATFRFFLSQHNHSLSSVLSHFSTSLSFSFFPCPSFTSRFLSHPFPFFP